MKGDAHRDVQLRRAAASATIAESATADADDLRARGIVDAAAWQSVVERWRATRRPYPTAYALWRLGEALLQSGDRKGASEVLAEAAAIADRLDAKPLAGAVAGLVGRAKIRFLPAAVAEDADATTEEPNRGRAPIDPFGLTTRELEVLGLLALGRTNRQIASELFISENTGGVHVSHILGKLGAGGRAEAAVIAARLGLAGQN